MKTRGETVDVAVVGAGIAGLAAAQTLKRTNLSVAVLEAKGRVGGRIHTDHDFASIPINLGAGLIHEQPTRTLARELGLGTVPQGRILVRQGSQWLRADDLRSLDDLDLEQLPDVSRQDEPLADYLKRAGVGREAWPAELLNLEMDTESLARWSTHAVAEELEAATSPEAASRGNALSDERIIGGHDRLLGAFAEVDVTLDAAVTHVDWRGDTVCLTLSDGRRLYAKRVILTLPVAVLQARRVRFTPELPAPKAQAVNAFGIVDAVKVFFHFPEKVMPEGVTGILTRELSPTFWWSDSAGYGGFSGELLTGWATGEPARQLIARGPEGALQTALTNLRTALDKPYLSPLASKVHHWNDDPYALGAYTYTPPGAAEARAALAQPLVDKLYWAGEATDPHLHGSVDGAMQSGVRAAKEVLGAAARSPASAL